MIIFLLIIGSLLVFLNLRALKKEKKTFSSVLNYTEDNMKEFEVRLGEVRREFSETILELQKEIQRLKKINENDGILDNYKLQDKEIEENYEETNMKSNNNIAEKAQIKLEEKVFENDESKYRDNITSNSIKIEEINKLLSKGLSVEEVSARLGIGKGEVLLIKELYLK
ncbi:hypothetical protein M2651_08115 [Clostridium sp. SYSU_GA19001]|uniref:DUF6115 domain-containing protein n=1 Tax=Clostridium caldaquaticum TaxID=2940653 RepID=UPI0020773B35|nr:hypothetical protein [Clostridium caldaquaticum]MCM8710989.1 hypothetical protein [Clostridium caldaquaticum]